METKYFLKKRMMQLKKKNCYLSISVPVFFLNQPFPDEQVDGNFQTDSKTSDDIIQNLLFLEKKIYIPDSVDQRSDCTTVQSDL